MAVKSFIDGLRRLPNVLFAARSTFNDINAIGGLARDMLFYMIFQFSGGTNKEVPFSVIRASGAVFIARTAARCKYGRFDIRTCQ